MLVPLAPGDPMSSLAPILWTAAALVAGGALWFAHASWREGESRALRVALIGGALLVAPLGASTLLPHPLQTWGFLSHLNHPNYFDVRIDSFDVFAINQKTALTGV